MIKRCIFIFTEGIDDKRLIENIAHKIIKKRGWILHIRQTAQLKDKEFEKYLQEAQRLESPVIIVRDIHSAKCVREKMKCMRSKYELLKKANICIAIKEISSWYCSGLTETDKITLGIPLDVDINKVTKKQIREYRMKTRYKNRISYLTEIIKRFKIQIAVDNSNSFRHFYFLASGMAEYIG